MINSKRKNILLTSVLCFNVLATAITPTAVMADTVTNNNLKATKSVVSTGNADHALLSIVSKKVHTDLEKSSTMVRK